MKNIDKDELMKQAAEAERMILESMSEDQRSVFERAEQMVREAFGVNDVSDIMKMSKKEQKERCEQMNKKFLEMMNITEAEAIQMSKQAAFVNPVNNFDPAEPSAETVDILKSLIKNAVYITPEMDIHDVALYASKFGGQPDLPHNFKWFRNSENVPLAFMAQINCEDVHKFDSENILPEHGILYFFYDLENQPWDSLGSDKYGAAVYYYNDDFSALEETEFPDDLPEECAVEQCGLTFSSELDAPSYEDYCFLTGTNMSDYNAYYASVKEALGLDTEKRDENKFKLLGYADIIQNSTLEELNDENEWVLLCQFDTYENGDSYVMYGDGGRLYYYIKRTDLAERKFDDIRIILQCY